jgi:beta-phosphoglucomutase-like phosphatase (HAD superfamily)
MRVFAVAFDLDGLMFDTEALFFRVSAEVLAARGKTFTSEIMNAMIGRRAIEAASSLKTLAGLDEPVEDLLEEVRQRFYAVMDTAVNPTPGLFVLLDHIRQRMLPIAVATSSRRSFADRLLIGHGLRERFAFVLAAEDVTCGKPDPEIYQLAAQRFGVAAGSVLVLEDSPAGVAAAKAAGAFTVAVPHEHSPSGALEAADLIVSRLDDPELIRLIDSRNQESSPHAADRPIPRS